MPTLDARGPSWMLRTTCSVLWLLLLCSRPTIAQAVFGGTTPPPVAVINEVLFDAPGVAGTQDTWQWVEVHVKTAAHCQDWELRGQGGAVLAAFPSVAVPAGSYVVVLFGPAAPEMENLDPTAGPLVFTTGVPFGDHLGLQSGVVKLWDGTQVIDKVKWARGPGAGPHVDISFATGTPLAEGDSIGRDRLGTDTDNASDFAVGGGANANGTTMGLPNVVELPDAPDLVQHHDAVANAIFMTLSQSEHNAGWLQVEATNPTAQVYAVDAANPDRLNFVSNHVFTIRVNGQPVQLSGQMQTEFTRDPSANATSESCVTSGSLVSSSGAWGLSMTVTRSAQSGALQTVVTYATELIWIHQWVPYQASLSGQETTTTTGDDTFVVHDSRTGTDFGSTLTKTAAVTATFTRTADGTHNVSSLVTRSLPSLLPYPGDTQNPASTETLQETFSGSVDGRGDVVSASITGYEQSVDGIVVTTLQNGRVGTISSSTTPTATGDVSTTDVSIPVDWSGSPLDITGNVTVTREATQGKDLSTGALAYQVGPFSSSSSFAIDPPVGKLPQEAVPLPYPNPILEKIRGKILNFIVTSLTCVGGLPGDRWRWRCGQGGRLVGKRAQRLPGRRPGRVPLLFFWCVIKAVRDL